ncbi:MAG: hypothetical protein R3C03_17725 [Pirellulaceae bacterium]
MDQLWTYELTADDAEGDVVAWRLIDAPLGATVNRETGVIRWIPGLEQVGVREFQVEARDLYARPQPNPLQFRSLASITFRSSVPFLGPRRQQGGLFLRRPRRRSGKPAAHLRVGLCSGWNDD